MQKYDDIFFVAVCVVRDKQGVWIFQLFTVPFSLALCVQNLYEKQYFQGKKN